MQDDAQTPPIDADTDTGHLATPDPHGATGPRDSTHTTADARNRQPVTIAVLVLAVVVAVSAGAAAVIFRGSLPPVAEFFDREGASTRVFDWDPFDNEQAPEPGAGLPPVR